MILIGMSKLTKDKKTKCLTIVTNMADYRFLEQTDSSVTDQVWHKSLVEVQKVFDNKSDSLVAQGWIKQKEGTY